MVDSPFGILHPASVDAEGVAAHGGLALLLEPFLAGAEDEPDAGLLGQVDADRDVLVLVVDADDVTVLEGLDLPGGELEDVHQVADVLADDGGGDVDDLVGAGVDLDETLGGCIVRGVTDDGLAGAECLLLLGRVPVQLGADQARMEDDVGVLSRVADQLEAGTGADGTAFLVREGNGKDRGETSVQDVMVDIGGKGEGPRSSPG